MIGIRFFIYFFSRKSTLTPLILLDQKTILVSESLERACVNYARLLRIILEIIGANQWIIMTSQTSIYVALILSRNYKP